MRTAVELGGAVVKVGRLSVRRRSAKEPAVVGTSSLAALRSRGASSERARKRTSTIEIMRSGIPAARGAILGQVAHSCGFHFG